MGTKGRDIYMRDAEDKSYKAGVLETSDLLEQLIGQIRMMLLTNRGEVLGAPDFGASLEEHLFTLRFNAQSMRSVLRDQTDKFVTLATGYGFTVDYDVQYVNGETDRMVLIDIKINGQKSFGIGIR